jgi:hypothetical protein
VAAEESATTTPGEGVPSSSTRCRCPAAVRRAQTPGPFGKGGSVGGRAGLGARRAGLDPEPPCHVPQRGGLLRGGQVGGVLVVERIVLEAGMAQDRLAHLPRVGRDDLADLRLVREDEPRPIPL